MQEAEMTSAPGGGVAPVSPTPSGAPQQSLPQQQQQVQQIAQTGQEKNLFLYKVIDREKISRDEVKQLWQEGKVTGLFNLPTEELFNACKDFGILADITELSEKESEVYELSQQLRTALSRAAEKERHIFDLKNKLAEQSSQFLLKEEQENVRRKDLAKANQTLRQEKKKLSSEKSELQSELQKVKNELQKVKLQRSQVKTPQKQQQVTPPPTPAPSHEAELQRKEQQRLQLRDDLKKEREHLTKVLAENRSLVSRVQQLTRENRELQEAGHMVSQNDHLNKKLLESFMKNMESMSIPLDEQLEDEEWETGSPTSPFEGAGHEWEQHSGEEAREHLSKRLGKLISDSQEEERYEGGDLDSQQSLARHQAQTATQRAQSPSSQLQSQPQSQPQTRNRGKGRRRGKQSGQANGTAS